MAGEMKNTYFNIVHHPPKSRGVQPTLELDTFTELNAPWQRKKATPFLRDMLYPLVYMVNNRWTTTTFVLFI